MTARLKAALAGQPAPPCEHFACTHRARCADDRLACDAFAEYVETGRVLRPEIVKLTDKPRRTFVPGTCQPTRGLYRVIFPSEGSQ